MELPSNTQQLTVVHLSPEEARLFIEFQKRYKFMQLLESVDAFSIKGGFVTIHFDNMGEAGSIDVQRRYRIIQ